MLFIDDVLPYLNFSVDWKEVAGKYVVATFALTGGCAVVPFLWLEEFTKCRWPSNNPINLTNWVINCRPLTANYDCFNITVKYRTSEHSNFFTKRL